MRKPGNPTLSSFDTQGVWGVLGKAHAWRKAFTQDGAQPATPEALPHFQLTRLPSDKIVSYRFGRCAIRRPNTLYYC